MEKVNGANIGEIFAEALSQQGRKFFPVPDGSYQRVKDERGAMHAVFDVEGEQVRVPMAIADFAPYDSTLVVEKGQVMLLLEMDMF